jgi:hypothetical protein
VARDGNRQLHIPDARIYSQCAPGGGCDGYNVLGTVISQITSVFRRVCKIGKSDC